MKNSINDAWEEICFILSENIKQNINERDFENQVIRAIEILGWKEFRKEIDRQPTLQVGRTNSIRPDIVIHPGNALQPIVVEIKKPSEDISLDESVGQLKSYMRQIKADFGWLLGKEIRVYYDGNLNPHPDDLLLLEKITYDKNDTKGINFVDIFTKDNFLSKGYVVYLNNKIGKYNEEKEISRLMKILLTDETKIKIRKFLESEFSDFGASVFDKAIDKLNINITAIQPTVTKSVLSTNRDLRQASPSNKRRAVITENSLGDNELTKKTYTIDELKLIKLDKTANPRLLEIDDKSYTVRNWTDLIIKFVEWLYEDGFINNDNVPIYTFSNRKEKYFINTEKQHKNSDKDAQWKEVGPFFVDTKYSADNHKRNIIEAIEVLHLEPNIKITFS